MINKKKILIISGTRPEVIKLFPVVRAFENSLIFEPIFLSTNQQNELLENTLQEFRILPDFKLGFAETKTLGESFYRILKGIDHFMSMIKPDYVMVQGDTTTAIAGAISGFLSQIPVLHLEAGLRTNQMYRPFPEEIYRQAISRFTSINLAPTQEAVENLIKEGISQERIELVGNSIVDSLTYQIQEMSQETFQVKKNQLLVTLHRRENFGESIIEICKGIRRFTDEHKNRIHIVVILHSNPNSFKTIQTLLGKHNNIEIIEPANRFKFLRLMIESGCILTDSGGVQEEAFLLGKKLLIARTETERPEVLNGDSIYVSANEDSINRTLTSIFNDLSETGNIVEFQGVNRLSPLGDGNTASRVVELMENYEKNIMD